MVSGVSRVVYKSVLRMRAAASAEVACRVIQKMTTRGLMVLMMVHIVMCSFPREPFFWLGAAY